MRFTTPLLGLLMSAPTLGATFPMPPPEFDLFGALEVVEAAHDDTLLDVARRHDIGQEEIIRANPEVDRWLPGAGAKVTIPSRYVLPAVPLEGLVLNMPEMRIYYFPKPEEGQVPEVQTYPVGVGRQDWATPLGVTSVIQKQKNPAWRPPASIRKEHEEAGDPLPLVVPPGPNNPLGDYAMRLGIPGYLIHGTQKSFGVGMRVSHGCVRMLPEDIEQLFPQVAVGTRVRIINQPAKAGWFGDKLYLEVHPPLEEDQAGRDALVMTVMDVIDAAQTTRIADLDDEAIARVIAEQNGIPTIISGDL